MSRQEFVAHLRRYYTKACVIIMFFLNIFSYNSSNGIKNISGRAVDFLGVLRFIEVLRGLLDYVLTSL